MTVTDNDAPDWTVTVDPAAIGEAGGESTVTVSTGGVSFPSATTTTLTFAGTATVTDDYTVTDKDRNALMAPYELTIEAGAESATAIVTAVDDSVADAGETIVVTASVDGTSIGEAQTVTITDNDQAGVTVSPTGVTATEGGATGSYTVVLDTRPSGTVTVTVGDTSDDISASPETLTFTGSTWDTAQTVTVTADDDSVAEGEETATLTHAVSGYGTVTTADSVTVTVADNDTAGVTVDPTAVTATEGGAAGSYTVTLTTQPTGTVTVTVGDTSDAITASPETLTFTTATWDTAQTVTVTADDDSIAEGQETATLTHAVSGYGTVTSASSVTVTIADNDTAGVAVDPTAVTATEGGATGSYTVTLTTQPTGTVTVTVGDTSDDISASPETLTFTGSTWDTAQTVTVTADDDSVAEGEETATLTHAVSGYGTVTTADSVTVTVADNDTAGVTVDPTAVTATEGGATGSYTVVLTTQPSGTVTVTVVDTSDDITASPETLTFTTATWDTSQTVTVTATDDSNAEGQETATLTHTVTSTDSDYEGATVVDVTVTVTDDDAANNAPVFDESSPAARSVAENTAAEQDIGAAVSATDADNDTLTYTLEGTDAASFDIVSGTGQIRTKAALDYETKASYSVTVKADDGQGGSATIAVTISITDVLEAPGAPTGLMAAAMGETQIVLSWTAPTDDGGADISGYRIEWSDDDDGPWTVLVEDTGSTSTSYTDTVTAGTIRWYRVFAINSVGAGAVSPTPVRGVSGGALTVAWESNNPPAEHRGGTGVNLLIEFSEDISGSASDRKTAGAVVTNAAVEQFKRTESGQNTRFTIRLTATDPAAAVTFTLPANRPCTETGAICTSGDKRLSNELEATLQPPRPPGMPTGLQGTADGETAIDLEWTAPADIGSGNITGYRIEWSADGSTNWADLVADTGNTDTTYADEGLDPGTTRHYRVSAINRAGPGDPSVSIEASARSPLTAAFENLPASHGGDGATFTFNVRFSELIETNVAGMRDNGITVTNGSPTLTRRVDGQKDYWVFDISPASTADVTITFEVPTDCAVQVYICTIDNRPLSEKLEGTVVFQAGAPGVPTSLTADAKATEIVLSWDAPLSTGGSAITGYRIELSTDAGVNWTELVASQTARSYTHGSLMAGDTRHYRVSAINANGTGTPTTPASATAGTLTASFTQIPATHDGSTAFAAQIQFSEAVGISADDFRDHAVTASGGSVTGATMVADDLFEITVAPTGASDVVLSLDADQPCSEDGAICGKDTKRRLSQALEATVLGLPVVGITGDAEPVVEGGTVTFTLKRSGSAADTLTVNLNVNLQGEFGLTGGTRTFAFASTETTGTLTFATTNDNDHEPDGSVEVVVQSGSGYVVDTDNNASLVAIEDNDGDATLSGLSLSRAGTNFPVSPPFSADTVTYTASVPNDVTAFKITATANDSNATVDITPADAGPSSGHQVAPEVGENTITITVTAEDGVTTRAYTVTVTRLAPPTVTIAAVTSLVIEDAATGVAFTLSRTGDLSAGLTVTVNVMETESMMCSAALGDQPVQFGANEAEKVLGADVLDICESQSVDSDSVVTATIVADDEYQIGDPGEATVTVEDSDLQVEVAVSVSATNPAEDAGDIDVTVRATTDQARCWFNNFDIRVSDTPTIDHGAVPGEDYSFTNATVTFRKGTATNAARCKLVETSSGTTVGRQEWTGTLSISEDVVVEGDEQFKVLLFEGGLPEAVTVTTGERIVTIKDNDEPDWTVTVDPAAIGEAGGESTVTVSTGGVSFPSATTTTLTFAGTATVTDDYTVTDKDRNALMAPYELTIEAGAESATAIVTAVDDSVADAGETIVVTASVDGTSIGEAQTVTITDDDTAGVTVSPTAVTATEGGATGSYTVVLETQPSGTVTVTVGDTSDDISASPETLTFTGSTWDTAQTVTVTADDDSVAEGEETATLTHAVSGYGTVTTADSVTVTVADNDTAGVAVNPTAVTATEGGAAGSYTVTLTTQPTGTVTVTVGDTSDAITASPETLTFTTATWDTAQTVTVTATDDSIAEGEETATLTHAVSGYGTVTSASSVTVTIADNDTAGVAVNPTAVTATEGGATGSYTVVLDTQPTGTVTVTVGDTSDDISASPETLTFTGSTWDTAQTVTVTADDDSVAEGEETATLTHAVSGYGTVTTADSVTVTVADNDTAGVTVDPTAVTATEGGATGSYTVVLDHAAHRHGDGDGDGGGHERRHHGEPRDADVLDRDLGHGADGDRDSDRRQHRRGRGDGDADARGERLRDGDDGRQRDGDRRRQRHGGGDGGPDGGDGYRGRGGGQLHGDADYAAHRNGDGDGGRHERRHHGEPRDADVLDRDLGRGADGDRDRGRRQRRRGRGDRDADACGERLRDGDDGRQRDGDRRRQRHGGGDGGPDGGDGDRGRRDRQLHGDADHAAHRHGDGDGGRHERRHHGEPRDADVHGLDLGHRADGDGDRGRRQHRRGRGDGDADARGKRLRDGDDGRQRDGDHRRQRHGGGDGGPDGGDGDRGRRDRQLHGGARHAAVRHGDGDGGRHERRHHGEPRDADVHGLDLGHRADGDGDRGRRQRRRGRGDRDADACGERLRDGDDGRQRDRDRRRQRHGGGGGEPDGGDSYRGRRDRQLHGDADYAAHRNGDGDGGRHE